MGKFDFVYFWTRLNLKMHHFSRGMNWFHCFVLTDIHEKFWPFCFRTFELKKSMGYGTRLYLKIHHFSRGRNLFISKVLTDVHEKFRPFYLGISISKKFMVSMKIGKISLSLLGTRLNFKMHHLSLGDELFPFLRF